MSGTATAATGGLDDGVGPDVRRQALEWLVMFWSGEVTDAEQRDFQYWLAASSEHERAWQQLQRLERRLHALPGPIASRTLRASKRRTILRALGFIAAGGVSAAYVGRETSPWRQVMADYRTSTGERRDIVLEDGTRVTLNTASAIDLRLDTNQRCVLLRVGEIFVVTAPDPSPVPRPFIVETSQGSIRAIGTRFAVRQMERMSHVMVLDGAVEIRPAANSGATVRLDAGQQVQFGDNSIEPPRIADPAAVAWTKGLLVAERMRLVDFLAQLDRYRSGIVRCDPAAADMIVSGVYPLEDTDRILESLVQALPIRISYATRYWVTVSPR